MDDVSKQGTEEKVWCAFKILKLGNIRF